MSVSVPSPVLRWVAEKDGPRRLQQWFRVVPGDGQKTTYEWRDVPVVILDEFGDVETKTKE